MAFKNIIDVPSSNTIFKRAVQSAHKTVIRRKKSDDKLTHLRKKELEKLNILTREIITQLNTIPKSFPSSDHLNEFYRNLMSLDTPLDYYKQNLGRLTAAKKTITSISRSSKGKIIAAQNPKEIISAVKSFHGRINSCLKKLDDTLYYLSDLRKKIVSYPVIKESFTVCIAGFPNAGKSTLFKFITDSKVDINSYAFTTKQLNVGYKTFNYTKVQFIDTPGTLNRNHSNLIEKQAELALKYLADLIIYVYDPTLEYSIEEQNKLLQRITSLNKPVITFASKADIVGVDKIRELFGNVETSREKLLDKISQISTNS